MVKKKAMTAQEKRLQKTEKSKTRKPNSKRLVEMKVAEEKEAVKEMNTLAADVDFVLGGPEDSGNDDSGQQVEEASGNDDKEPSDNLPERLLKQFEQSMQTLIEAVKPPTYTVSVIIELVRKGHETEYFRETTVLQFVPHVGMNIVISGDPSDYCKDRTLESVFYNCNTGSFICLVEPITVCTATEAVYHANKLTEVGWIKIEE